MIRGTARRLFERLVASNTSFTGRLAAAILRRHYHWRLGLVDADRRPNSDPLWQFLRDINSTKLSLKFFGYELARSLAATMPPPTGLAPRRVDLASKPSTQADLESDWARYWIAELKVAHIFHRKLWEYAYVLQALHENGQLRPGAKGLGFGCGSEPLPSYFANAGVSVTVTDQTPDAAAAQGWTKSDEHTSSIDAAFRPELVTRDSFDRSVKLRYVDMNAIPSNLRDFDFCWSICALEHLGTIRKGLEFIENSLAILRRGGIAVHTTEFNFLDEEQTIDNAGTVLFQRRHFRELAARLQQLGHHVAPLDFDVGNKPLDRFIDLPPYLWEWTAEQKAFCGADVAHLKLWAEGFACTCFGLIIRKG